MNDDFDFVMESCGWGTDEQYGYYGDPYEYPETMWEDLTDEDHAEMKASFDEPMMGYEDFYAEAALNRE
jgi:hypothetical protein